MSACGIEILAAHSDGSSSHALVGPRDYSRAAYRAPQSLNQQTTCPTRRPSALHRVSRRMLPGVRLLIRRPGLWVHLATPPCVATGSVAALEADESRLAPSGSLVGADRIRHSSVAEVNVQWVSRGSNEKFARCTSPRRAARLATAPRAQRVLHHRTNRMPCDVKILRRLAAFFQFTSRARPAAPAFSPLSTATHNNSPVINGFPASPCRPCPGGRP